MSIMRDIPIAFSPPLIRALDEERKTMTRRNAWMLQKMTKKIRAELVAAGKFGMAMPSVPTPWQKVRPGFRLWVKEDLQRYNRVPHATVQYVSTISGVPHRGVVAGGPDGRAYWNWRTKYIPARYCPRWASRFTLIVAGVKIERIQDITDDDAIAEGVEHSDVLGGPWRHYLSPDVLSVDRPRDSFFTLWLSLHGSGSWDANPEVVALTFKVVKKNIDELPKAEAA